MEFFRLRPVRRILAALVVAVFSTFLLFIPESPAPALGFAIIAVCVVVIAFSIPSLRGQRSDPYDLARLFDEPPESPEHEAEDEELVCCWVCGDAFPKKFDLCPHCGNRFKG